MLSPSPTFLSPPPPRGFLLFGCCSVISDSLQPPWTAACQASLSFTISWSLFKFMSIESVMPSNYPILCCPFSSCLQSFPAWGSFPRSQLFPSGGHSIGVSPLASDLLMNIQDRFPLGLTGFISLKSKGLSRVFSNTTVQKHRFFGVQRMVQLLYGPTLTSIHDHGKNCSFDCTDLCRQSNASAFKYTV